MNMKVKWNKKYLKSKGNSGMSKTARDFLTIKKGEIRKSLDNYSQI